MKKTKLFLASLLASFLLLTTGCGDGSSASNIKIPGVDGPRVTLLEDNVLITMIFENMHLDGGLRYNIPKYPNSYVELSPDLQSDGTLMAVSVSLQDIFHGDVNQLDPQTLPGGRALPGVLGGKLPAVAFTIEKFKDMSFYLGNNVFGVFVPTKDLGIGTSIISARFYSGKNRVGNISLIGVDDQGDNSGVLLMLDMGNKTKSKLKSLAQKFE